MDPFATEWISCEKNSKTGTQHIYISWSTDTIDRYKVGLTDNPHHTKMVYERTSPNIKLMYRIVDNMHNMEGLILNVLIPYRIKKVDKITIGETVKMNKSLLTLIVDWCINNIPKETTHNTATSDSIYSSSMNILVCKSSSTISYRDKIHPNTWTDLCITLVPHISTLIPTPMDIAAVDGHKEYVWHFSQDDFDHIVSLYGK